MYLLVVKIPSLLPKCGGRRRARRTVENFDFVAAKGWNEAAVCCDDLFQLRKLNLQNGTCQIACSAPASRESEGCSIGTVGHLGREIGWHAGQFLARTVARSVNLKH